MSRAAASGLWREAYSCQVTTGRRIDEIGDESRRRILDAAEKLFSEKGFERTSFVDIARESGISRGSIPWHFKSKDGLLLAVVERLNQRAMHTGEIPAEELTVQRLLDMWVNLVRSDGARVLFMLLTEAMHSEALVHEQYVAYLAEQRAVIRYWLRVWGLDAARAKGVSGTICSVLIGAQLQWQVDPQGFDLNGVREVLASMIEAEIEQAAAAAAAPPRARKARARSAS